MFTGPEGKAWVGLRAKGRWPRKQGEDEVELRLESEEEARGGLRGQHQPPDPGRGCGLLCGQDGREEVASIWYI